MPELCSVFVCVFPAYLAVTVSTRLVTVGVKAFICVTVTWSTGRRPPPTPRTLVVNSTHIHTDSRISNEWVESAQREKATERDKNFYLLIKGIMFPSDF